ncbi:MAG: hypothetical protein ACPGJV_06140 [Bacteriovoracaceae bacterium]
MKRKRIRFLGIISFLFLSHSLYAIACLNEISFGNPHFEKRLLDLEISKLKLLENLEEAKGLVLIETKSEKKLVGEIEIIKFGSSYSAVFLKNSQTSHLIDQKQIKGIYASLDNQVDLLFKETSNSKYKPFLEFDEPKVKDYFCKNRSYFQNTHEGKMIAKALSRNVPFYKNAVFNRKVMAMCLSSAGMGLATPYTIEKRKKGEHNFFTNHHTNFTEGWALMSVLYACPSLLGLQSSAYLGLILGANTLGQVLAEIGMGQENLLGPFGDPSHGKRHTGKVKTDYYDFASGLSSIILFYTSMKFIENRFGYQFKSICR